MSRYSILIKTDEGMASFIIYSHSHCNMKLLICLSIFSQIFFILDVQAKSRKLALSWEKMEPCPDFDNKVIDISKVTIYMANESSIGLKGTIDVLEDIDTRPLVVKSVVEKDVGGTFMVVLNYNLDDLCDTMEKDESWNPYLTAMNPSLTNCPIKKNTYDVANVRPQSPDMELKKEMIGSYRTRIEMMRPPKNSALPGPPELWCCYTLNFKIDSV